MWLFATPPVRPSNPVSSAGRPSPSEPFRGREACSLASAPRRAREAVGPNGPAPVRTRTGHCMSLAPALALAGATPRSAPAPMARAGGMAPRETPTRTTIVLRSAINPSRIPRRPGGSEAARKRRPVALSSKRSSRAPLLLVLHFVQSDSERRSGTVLARRPLRARARTSGDARWSPRSGSVARPPSWACSSADVAWRTGPLDWGPFALGDVRR